jgi:two-component system, NtrC family, nitrogen regulation sensor histidine kinase NtrY
MTQLRTRLIAVFVLATIVPLGLTLWTTLNLLDRGLELAPLDELRTVTGSLESTGRELYQQARESLRHDAAEGRVVATVAAADALANTETEAFALRGNDGDELHYFVRKDGTVYEYVRPLRVPLHRITTQIAGARRALDVPTNVDIRGAFSRTLLFVAAALWLTALGALIYLATRISRPIRELTQGLGKVAAGDLSTRLSAGAEGEIGEAMTAFNHMAAEMQHGRERLIQVTRVASWQALARKMAHEVKNSLTPIRLTVEEMVSRQSPDPFLEQAAQIVGDEITTLEKRVRAFSQFAAEPPVAPAPVDLNTLIEERIALLRAAHPSVHYQTRLRPDAAVAHADPDLIKGVLTNLLENAAQAVEGRGTVLARTAIEADRVQVEVHDSGPGLSEQARASLFQPTISFKKGGMGLGLSIARRSAILCGGDLEVVAPELGGAAFRLTLPMETHG